MRSWALGIGVGLVLCGGAPVASAEGCGLPPGETAEVSSVLDGETLALEDGREVRLLGIQAPAPPPDWEGPEPWPFAAKAKEALAAQVEGGTVDLRFDTRRQDRHGHVLAHVFRDQDGKRVWVQEALVAEGLARVAALPDLGACLRPLLTAEAQARTDRRGLWRSLTYQVRDAHDPKRLGHLRHSYQLVEGTVHGIGEGRKLVYVNFAEDWRSDFTVTITRKRLPALEAAGLDLASLPGKRIRVRGWVES